MCHTGRVGLVMVAYWHEDTGNVRCMVDWHMNASRAGTATHSVGNGNIIQRDCDALWISSYIMQAKQVQEKGRR